MPVARPGLTWDAKCGICGCSRRAGRPHKDTQVPWHCRTAGRPDSCRPLCAANSPAGPFSAVPFVRSLGRPRPSRVTWPGQRTCGGVPPKDVVAEGGTHASYGQDHHTGRVREPGGQGRQHRHSHSTCCRALEAGNDVLYGVRRTADSVHRVRPSRLIRHRPFCEPFFQELDANVQISPAMNGEDLQNGLGKLS